jgi:hypothetical protein
MRILLGTGIRERINQMAYGVKLDFEESRDPATRNEPKQDPFTMEETIFRRPGWVVTERQLECKFFVS